MTLYNPFELVSTEATLQEVRDRFDTPIDVRPQVAGAPVSGTNPMPISGVFGDENGVPFSSANPLPVSVSDMTIESMQVNFPDSVVSDPNSRNTPLAANEEFVGSWTDVLQYAAIQVVVLTDQNSAANGAVVEFSDDATLALRALTATIPANTGLSFMIPPQARYARLRYKNGPVAQGMMRAQTILAYQAPTTSNLPLGSSTSDLYTSQVSMAHLKARHSTGAWLPIATDGLGNLRIAGTVSLAAASEINLSASTLAALETITTQVTGTVDVTGTVAVSNLPAVQEVSGAITATVDNFPAIQEVTGTVGVEGTVGLDAAALAALETTNVGNFPAVQPINDNGGSLTVDGTVAVNNFPESQPVTGSFLTNAQLRATAVPITGTVDVGNLPATTEITNDAGNPVPVSGTVEITNDAGNAIPVSGAFYPATQPVSGTVEITNDVGSAIPVSGPLTDVQLRAAAVPVSGTVSVGNFPASTEIANDAGNPVPVSGPVTNAELRASALPVSGTVTVGNFPTATEITNDAGNPIPVSGPLTDAQLRAADLEVADDYAALEVLADQVGADGVLTFTFSSAVNLAVVHAVGIDLTARATTTAQTPSASLGVRCPDDVPTFLPVTTGALRVFAPAGMTITAYGYRRA